MEPLCGNGHGNNDAASLVTRQPLRVIGSAIKGNGEAREQNKKEKKSSAHMARLILMYEMQSAAVKSAPRR